MTSRRKIPTKAELLQLQKLYKTDEKIGERLGGVPSYLVAYWRRKKNVPRHSLPKFSEKEIRSLWERYGDDDRCGLELGISKAAFYNWRRRYGIKEKPAFLKLEQLELDFPGMKPRSVTNSLYGKKTVAQKIFARVASRTNVEVGERLDIEPDLVLARCEADGVIERFREHKVEFLWNPNKVVFASLPIPLSLSAPTPNGYDDLLDFIKRQRVRAHYDFVEGSGLQVAMENGHVLPGDLALSASAEVSAFGAMATLAWPVDESTMAAVWAEGKLQVEVPPTIRIDITGRKSRAVSARDVILSIIGRLTATGAEGKIIEYHGSTVSQMSIGERYTLCALSTVMGAVAALCPFDSVTRRYLAGRTGATISPIITDKNAVYAEMYQINIEHLPPQIGMADGVDKVKPLEEVETLPVNQIYLGGCTNGRFEDLRIAADILKGRKVNPQCRLMIYPASRTTYLEALKKGLIRILSESGAVIMPPGCRLHFGPVWSHAAKGDRCLTTGHPSLSEPVGADGAEVYSCSPATAAASAINAAITDPTRYGK